jgi:3-oxoacyl-(acyl-carrier-protein) synthase
VAAERDLRIGAVAFEIARAQSGIALETLAADRVGIVLGCALAGQAGMIAFAEEVRQQSPRFVSPIHFPQTVGNYPAGGLGRGYHVRGPNITLSGGTASGLDAVVTAVQLIAAGDADVVIAGGLETLTPQLATCVGAAVAPADGACFFLLEHAASAERRGVAPLAVVRDSAQSSATHWNAPADCQLLSCAGCCVPGAIAIEQWIGGCLAAAGAATVAAAIGAAWGTIVPFYDTSNPSTVQERSVSVESGDVSFGGVAACAIADADGGGRTMIELRVSPRP